MSAAFLTDSTPSPSDVAAAITVPQTRAALSGTPEAIPSAVTPKAGVPDLLVPMPSQTHGGDVDTPPHAPVPAVHHIGNRVQPLGLMWASHVHELQEKLHRAGIERTDTQVDNAIQGAREAANDEDGVYPNIDSEYGWWLIHAKVADYLEVDYDLIFEVAP